MHEILLSHYQALLPRQQGRTLCLGTFGSFGTETLRIISGAGWKDLTITATFHPLNASPVRMLLPADGILHVPGEAMAAAADEDAGAVIVFTGTSEGVQRISADLPYTVLTHAPIEGEEAVPTANEWQQLTAAYQSKVDKHQGPEHSGKVLGIDEQGNVTPVVYTGGSGTSGGTAAPADWSINDSTQPGYIHHRTHWMEEKQADLIPDMAIQPEGNVYIMEMALPFFVGETYQVTWDGAVYSCTCYTASLEGMELLVLGNSALFGGGENTGEPFAAITVSAFAQSGFFATDSNIHTVSIRGMLREYHPLSPEYLPPLVGASTTDKEYDINGETYSGGFGAEVFNAPDLNKAVGRCSHAEGQETIAKGEYSHAEGFQTIAEGDYTHAEGMECVASGDYSHAEGVATIASGTNSHAEGWNTVASMLSSHAEGSGTIANGAYQHVEGKYNQPNSRYAHILGGGSGDNSRKNIHTIDWNGNVWFAGSLTLAGHPILTAADGTQYALRVNPDGTLFTALYTG